MITHTMVLLLLFAVVGLCVFRCEFAMHPIKLPAVPLTHSVYFSVSFCLSDLFKDFCNFIDPCQFASISPLRPLHLTDLILAPSIFDFVGLLFEIKFMQMNATIMRTSNLTEIANG